MKVAVLDIGSNSTRLLVADVRDGAVTELDRRSVVTRLGEGVDRSGRLTDAAQQRVLRVAGDYARAIEEHGCERRDAVLTSAVRDAENGAELTERIEALGLRARTLTGDEEAELTFRGASAGRDDADLLVIDVGGGSTELVAGSHGRMRAHVSTQNGVVRHSERHLHDDPPTPEQLGALAHDVRANLSGTVPFSGSSGMSAVAVAGTATQCAAIDLGLEPYDASRVEGHVLTAVRLGELLELTGALPLAQRRGIRGLDPDRAPVIVAGIAILLEVLAFFDLDRFAASEHDILWGVALTA